MADRNSSSFQVFEARQRPKQLAADEVSLGQTNILISRELAQQFTGGSRSIKVVLLYNRQPREIGIRLAAPQESAFKLSARNLSARSFYEHFDITERGRFRAAINQDGILVIPLSRR